MENTVCLTSEKKQAAILPLKLDYQGLKNISLFFTFKELVPKRISKWAEDTLLTMGIFTILEATG